MSISDLSKDLIQAAKAADTFVEKEVFFVVGITGITGGGKSTLISHMLGAE